MVYLETAIAWETTSYRSPTEIRRPPFSVNKETKAENYSLIEKIYERGGNLVAVGLGHESFCDMYNLESKDISPNYLKLHKNNNEGESTQHGVRARRSVGIAIPSLDCIGVVGSDHSRAVVSPDSMEDFVRTTHMIPYLDALIDSEGTYGIEMILGVFPTGGHVVSLASDPYKDSSINGLKLQNFIYNFMAGKVTLPL